MKSVCTLSFSSLFKPRRYVREYTGTLDISAETVYSKESIRTIIIYILKLCI